MDRGVMGTTPAGRSVRVVDIRVFSSASDAPRARRPTDAVLLAGAVLAIAATALLAPGPRTLDTEAASLLQALPGLLGWFWEICYDLLFVWAVVIVSLTLVAHGRSIVLRHERIGTNDIQRRDTANLALVINTLGF